MLTRVMSKVLALPALGPAVFLICLAPLARLVWRGLTDDLGANPIEALVRSTGLWTLIFLLITLAVTPAGRLPGLNRVARFRRLFGLFAFFYACLHAATYVGVDQFFAWGDIVADVVKRPFITIGAVSFAALAPLAVTSTNGMIRRMGGRRWKLLHRLVYPIAIGGVVHYFWLVKADVRPPLIYGSVLVALLGIRLWTAFGRTEPRRDRSPAVTGNREALHAAGS
ncbi:MAG: sulfite oxidase heme-binding subunit YedZ [Nitrospirota bacterium]